jgi:hypothetical protein
VLARADCLSVVCLVRVATTPRGVWLHHEGVGLVGCYSDGLRPPDRSIDLDWWLVVGRWQVVGCRALVSVRVKDECYTVQVCDLGMDVC